MIESINPDQNPEISLPLEVYRDVIFVKLPVKTLLRFRCVCKTWCSIIDDPTFGSLHHAIFNNNFHNRSILCWELSLQTPESEDDRDQQDKNLLTRVVTRRSDDTFEECEEIVCVLETKFDTYVQCFGYIDGLFLLKIPCSSSLSDEMILWNPSIRKYLKIPPNPSCGCSVPSHVTRVLLGYDSSIDDYKVVLIHALTRQPSLGASHCLLAVYTLKTGCWRLECRFDDYIKLFCKYRSRHIVILTKGFAHWLACDRNFNPGKTVNTHVISFDFVNESLICTKIPGDGVIEIGERITLPFCFKDSFAVFSMSPTSSSIWVMEKYGKSFGMVKKWSHENANDSYLGGYEFFKNYGADMGCFYVDKDGKFLFHHAAGRVKSYDLESHEIKYMKNDCYDYYMNSYVESLLLCNGFDCQTFPLEGINKERWFSQEDY